MPDEDKESSVRVAVRIRPQIPRELIDMCRVCTQVTPGEPQVLLGSDKAFTFDYVFDMSTTQVSVYNNCIEKLVDGALQGYNATVLAYGQTGSGKTYTMGTGFERAVPEAQEGIIPRAVRHLFEGIAQLQQNPYDENGTYLGTVTFSVAAQFMELYNEEIIDLLDPYNKGARVFKIFEDSSGGISVAGATIKPLAGPQEALNCLQQGALARTTASTQMNEQSSRSHALFTILIRRQRVMTAEQCGNADGDTETLTSKFHFVDLAGSERLKRTGATGERAREGISINCGLLALGNVISALGDKTKKVSHVPYRDSKLTRLLQDSLGGNSQTIMIACVSPSDRDFMETLNTLKYANRARNIKNKVQINQDQSSRTISLLRREIANLQLEILEYKQGKRSIDADGNIAISDASIENEMLTQDNKRMQQRIKAMQETINALTEKNAALQAQQTISSLNKASAGGDGSDPSSTTNDSSLISTTGGNESAIQELIVGYISEIEKLKAKLIESEQMFQQFKKAKNSQSKLGLKAYPFIEDNPETVINLLKHEMEKERETLMSRSLPGLENESSSLEQNSDSDSDTESDDKAEVLRAEIFDVNSDIELKVRLIEQLEESQQRLQIMRQQYEKQFNLMKEKISNTERERDEVLATIGNGGMGATNNKGQNSTNESAIKRVKDDYERKLNEMRRQLNHFQATNKEHLRLQRNMQAQDAKIKTLRGELAELKQVKTRLMKKIQEESNRHKEMESRKTREIAQLRKETRKHKNMIKSLQAQGAAKDQVLKRKTEEVFNLRKSQRGVMSLKAAGRVPATASINSMLQGTKRFKMRWEELQRTIMRAARSRQAILELEMELERVMQERDMLCRDLNNLRQRRKDNAESTLHDLVSEEDTLIANMNYLHDTIDELQKSIIQIEDGKDLSTEHAMLQTLMDNIGTVEEAKFMLQRVCSVTIGHVCEAGVTQSKLRERDALLTELQRDTSVQEQLLQYILTRAPATSTSETSFSSAQSANSYVSQSQSNLLENGEPQPSSSQYRLPHVVDSTTRSPSPSNSNTNLDSIITYRNSSKQRRNPAVVPSMATIQDLLYGSSSGYIGPAGDGVGMPDRNSNASTGIGGADASNGVSSGGSKLEKVGICIYLEDSADEDDTKHPPSLQDRHDRSDVMTRSYTILDGAMDPVAAANAGLPIAPPPPVAPVPARTFVPLSRVPSAPGSLKGLQPHQGLSRQNSTASPLLARKSFEASAAPPSPRISRRTFTSKMSPGIEDANDVPTSPPVYRRGVSREDNGDVFSRLGAGTQDPQPGGNIKELNGRYKAGSPLICTHVVEGHSNSVLSIKVSNQMLFTAAADRTVKVWDLRANATPHCLTGHLGPVAAVEYDRVNNLLFSASGAFVKVWDLRSSNIRPIITLCSSGTTLPANATLSDLVPGECSITALTMGASGKLYTAASDKVRFWDLRQFSCLGRLSGGHQAAVMCLTAWEGPNNTDLVATGSKDHYVKVFEVNSSGGVVQPLLNLEPPHYDGVQALAVANDAIGVDAELFSGSRDSGIKRWDLRNGELKQSLNNAHKGWVSGMAIYGDILLSSCRGGVVRLWNIKTCDSLAEMKTEQSINDIVTSDNRVFTASNSGEVRIWRFVTTDWDSLNASSSGAGSVGAGSNGGVCGTLTGGTGGGSVGTKTKR
ncbi:kinesin-like protein KIF21A isoform X1 [Anopheles funestus]|uniref:kinesin-like protein KIF21A isoform X1 n=1 Tax=Anopheles funestus TaxID=62324 RepID=UPI0020C63EE9|nr:kinesin-like protein KIF21A isoform X1 [Anopheles funestus]XP_049283370.1 kinesin-like protein KIF21A isoform X1 [Anopheles funestus]XP_049283371.1 kinesin-like protein KIF21A isoform X1 [Anopheles funestus]XP_049283373.1 kinesin-like protein KIF21A isoform X1 [Anopheles funestus]XP_049283374.1 kinesin-like protein KIF21A isoform X1 [Anopheles funestus]XP_049283375.1 kinesin-like protein KIF21A isoform X1 [Anopheles funestus]XP_049283376.1 kinesin-like protein KIF21A isoform X1 [Anopheles 